MADQLGWPVLHSDELRKALAGVGATTHMPAELDEGIDAEGWNSRTYDALCTRARRHLERGRSVVLDASWREAAGASPRNASKSVEVSAATLAASARRIASRFDPWPGAQVIDTTTSTDAAVAEVVRVVTQS